MLSASSWGDCCKSSAETSVIMYTSNLSVMIDYSTQSIPLCKSVLDTDTLQILHTDLWKILGQLKHLSPLITPSGPSISTNPLLVSLSKTVTYRGGKDCVHHHFKGLAVWTAWSSAFLITIQVDVWLLWAIWYELVHIQFYSSVPRKKSVHHYQDHVYATIWRPNRQHFCC